MQDNRLSSRVGGHRRQNIPNSASADAAAHVGAVIAAHAAVAGLMRRLMTCVSRTAYGDGEFGV